MMIRVVYRDGRYDMVKRWTLERLLEQNELQGFCRATGWVKVDRDRLRVSQSGNYRGEERRVPVNYPRASNLQ